MNLNICKYFFKRCSAKGRIMMLISALITAVLLLSYGNTPLSVYSADTQDTSAVLDPFAEGASYSSIMYNNTNGLPTSEANAIVQTSEGFIWIGSYGGLVRYDGNNFERMDSSLGFSGIISLFVDSHNRLWIGSNDSGLAMLDKDVLLHWGVDEGLKSLSVNCIEEDITGRIYVGTKNGILMADNDFKLHPLTNDLIKDICVEKMNLGEDGLIYCLSKDMDLFTLKDGEVVSFCSIKNSTDISGVKCILPDNKNPGFVYLGTEFFGIFYCEFKNGSIKNINEIYVDPLYSLEGMYYIDDKLWICGTNGIGTLENNEVRVLDNLPMNNKISSIMADNEGNLWITSTRQGVLKITPNRFTDIYNRYNLKSSVVNSTCMYNGKLYIATDTGLEIIDENGPLSTTEDDITEDEDIQQSNDDSEYENYSERELIRIMSDERIRSLIRDSKNRLWLSVWTSFGLYCYDNGKLRSYSVNDGLPSSRVRTVYEKKDGSIIVATSGGLAVIENDKVTKKFTEEDGLENTEILTVAEDADGEILAGSDGGGLYIIGNDSVRTLRTNDGLSSETILRLKPDYKRNIIWIITSNSISYMSPDHSITVIKDFPYSNNFDLVQNKDDNMWVLSSNGIYVVPTETMLKNEKIEAAHYSILNGLPCVATANSYSGSSDDGDLYIAGNTGVVKVNIESEYKTRTDYKVAVPYIDIDGERMFPDKNGNFTVPADIQKLTIHAFVFNYSLVNPQVSYCLDGFSDKFTTVDSDELDPIDYTNLFGGEYKFIINVTDPLGKSVKTMTVKIKKEKAFYEMLWFYILIGAALSMIIGIAVHIFIDKKIKRLKKKHKEEVEKERLVTELQTASKIQSGMLPREFPPFPDRSEFDIFASMDPAKEVGGDFYDFFLVDDDHLCIEIADVSGKGVPAALFMMSAKIIIANYAKMGKTPAEILTLTNKTICANNQEDMFVTVWIGILEISTGKLTAANAGHEYPVLMQPNGNFELYKDKHGFVIGGMNGVRYKQYEIQLEPGAKLFVYTDGVPEATNSENQLFGTERMIEALNERKGSSPQALLKNVRWTVDGFVKNAEQFDDLTMLCIEYRGES